MLDTLLGIRAGGWVTKDPSDDYWYSPRGSSTISGVDMNEESAITITTVFACVSKASKAVASLPIDVVERTGPRTRQPVDHPLGELLDGSASDEASSMTLREGLSANHELWGNAYAHVSWVQRGSTQEPARLDLLQSKYVTPKRDSDTGAVVYEYRDGQGTGEVLPAERVWHIPGFTLNGIVGLSVVGYNREALGLAAVATQFGAAFFGNGAWAGGFVQQKQGGPELSEIAAQRLLTSLNEQFRGAHKAFGFGLLREGMEFKQIDMPFEDAMFLATRQFQRTEICGMFDVPPAMIQDHTHSTYSNTEQADIAFSKHSLVPRCARIEKAAYHRFFKGTKLRLKHNLAGLERGDFVTRMNGYATGRQWGLYSINDIRYLEDMNPVDGGNTYLEPLNMKPVGDPFPVATPKQAGGAEALEPITVTHSYPAAYITPFPAESITTAGAPPVAVDALAVVTPAIRHAAEIIAARQFKGADAAWKKHARDGRPDTFAQWADKFFVEHADIVLRELAPITESYTLAGGSVSGDSVEWAGRLCRNWRESLSSDVTTAQETILGWKTGLVEEIAAAVTCYLSNEKDDSDE